MVDIDKYQNNFLPNQIREVVKKRIFYGQADRKGWTAHPAPRPPPIVVIFFGVSQKQVFLVQTLF